MAKNELARRMQEAKSAGMREGLMMGMQFTSDVLLICLHRQGWGFERAKRLLDQMWEAADYFADGFVLCMEQDGRQEQMDRELLDLIKGRQDFSPFRERYPNVMSLGYDKLPGWLRRGVTALPRPGEAVEVTDGN